MAQRIEFSLRAKVWRWQGAASWHFVSVDKKNSRTIRELFGTPRHGWGSIPVTVTLGGSMWKTSIFPDSKRGAYILPLKALVRKAEGIATGDTARFTLRIRGV